MKPSFLAISASGEKKREKSLLKTKWKKSLPQKRGCQNWNLLLTDQNCKTRAREKHIIMMLFLSLSSQAWAFARTKPEIYYTRRGARYFLIVPDSKRLIKKPSNVLLPRYVPNSFFTQRPCFDCLFFGSFCNLGRVWVAGSFLLWRLQSGPTTRNLFSFESSWFDLRFETEDSY